MLKIKSGCNKQMSLVVDLLQFARFGKLRNVMKNGWPTDFKKSSKSIHWASMVEFFWEVLKGCVF